MNETTNKVQVGGREFIHLHTNEMEMTPEYLMNWMANTERPAKYREGMVTIKLGFRELSWLFGDVVSLYRVEGE